MKGPESRITRPAKELKAFKKVLLKAGEQKAVQLEVPVRDLAVYNEFIRNWMVEPGDYQMLIGSSSRDIRGSVVITVQDLDNAGNASNPFRRTR